MKLEYFTPAIILSLSMAILPVCAMAVDSQSIDSKIENLGSSARVKVVGLMVKEIDGFLSVQIEVDNQYLVDHRQDARNIYYRIKWLDQTGFQVWDDEPWKPVLIQGGARQTLQARAPTTKAKDFRIQYNVQGNRSND
jgi:uncharacterized protein YcfL